MYIQVNKFNWQLITNIHLIQVKKNLKIVLFKNGGCCDIDAQYLMK